MVEPPGTAPGSATFIPHKRLVSYLKQAPASPLYDGKTKKFNLFDKTR